MQTTLLEVSQAWVYLNQSRSLE